MDSLGYSKNYSSKEKPLTSRKLLTQPGCGEAIDSTGFQKKTIDPLDFNEAIDSTEF